MYSNTSKFVATGVIVTALIAATPVFADSDHGESNSGLRLGALANVLADVRSESRETRREHREENTSEKPLVIDGTVTFISGTTLTVQGRRGDVYTVNAANATIIGHAGSALQLSAIAVHDKVKVTGSLSNNVIIATKIKDKSDESGKVTRSVNAGIVTAINGATVLLNNFGASGMTSATVNTDTKYFANGNATTSSALDIGSHVIIAGTSTVGGSLNASIVLILTEGLGWLKHFFR